MRAYHQSSGPLQLAIVDGLDVRDSRLPNIPPRYNGAPSQELLVIRRNHKTGEECVVYAPLYTKPEWAGTLRASIRERADFVASFVYVGRTM